MTLSLSKTLTRLFFGEEAEVAARECRHGIKNLLQGLEYAKKEIEKVKSDSTISKSKSQEEIAEDLIKSSR